MKKTLLVISFMVAGMTAFAEERITLNENDSTITYNGIKIANGADDNMFVKDVDQVGVGLYCKYSPMSVMKKNYGPDFKSVSVGIYF